MLRLLHRLILTFGSPLCFGFEARYSIELRNDIRAGFFVIISTVRVSAAWVLSTTTKVQTTLKLESQDCSPPKKSVFEIVVRLVESEIEESIVEQDKCSSSQKAVSETSIEATSETVVRIGTIEVRRPTGVVVERLQTNELCRNVRPRNGDDCNFRLGGTTGG